MIRRISTLVALAALVFPAAALAQSTGMPSYNAPYRAFTSYEFGGTLSFPGWDNGTGLEGQFRAGYKTWDIGVQGGIFDADGPGGTIALLGATGRVRVVTHNETFPLDGALILGAGTQDFDNFITYHHARGHLAGPTGRLRGLEYQHRALRAADAVPGVRQQRPERHDQLRARSRRRRALRWGVRHQDELRDRGCRRICRERGLGAVALPHALLASRGASQRLLRSRNAGCDAVSHAQVITGM